MCVGVYICVGVYTCVYVCAHMRTWVLVFILSKRPLHAYQIGYITLEDSFTLSISFITNL